MPQNSRKQKTPPKRVLALVPPKPPQIQRKPPSVFLHINLDDRLYQQVCDIRDTLNTPHLAPDTLTLEELHLLNEQCKGRDMLTQRQRIAVFFANKSKGPIKIPGVGAYTTPHSIGEVINICVAFAMEHSAILPLPDHTQYTREDAEDFIIK